MATAEIMKLQGQENKWYVEFKRKAGSAALFYETAYNYINQMDECKNATIDNAEENEEEDAEEFVIWINVSKIVIALSSHTWYSHNL